MKPRRVIFIAYYHAPMQAVAAVRATHLARVLVPLGWEVEVLTPACDQINRRDTTLPQDTEAPEGLRIRRLPHPRKWLHPDLFAVRNRGLARLVRGSLRVVARRLGIEPESGWRGALDHALAQVERGNADVLLSTGGPWFAHDVAARHARRLGVPLVLDYRDLRLGNPYAANAASPWLKRRESRTRAAAAAITGVSPTLLSYQQELFGDCLRSFCVPNGYPPRPLAPTDSTSSRTERAVFTLLYAGRLYAPGSTLTPFLDAFRLLQERAPRHDLRLRYMGPNAREVRAELQVRPLAGVEVEEVRPREEALRALSECDVALISASNDTTATPPHAGIVTGKLFEILAARRPYLLIAPRNSDARSIVAIAGGGKAFTAGESAAMADYLHDILLDRPPAYLAPEAYAWPNLAKLMDGALRHAIDHRGDARP